LKVRPIVFFDRLGERQREESRECQGFKPKLPSNKKTEFIFTVERRLWNEQVIGR
jgi:hypothetical protein